MQTSVLSPVRVREIALDKKLHSRNRLLSGASGPRSGRLPWREATMMVRLASGTMATALGCRGLLASALEALALAGKSTFKAFCCVSLHCAQRNAAHTSRSAAALQNSLRNAEHTPQNGSCSQQASQIGSPAHGQVRRGAAGPQQKCAAVLEDKLVVPIQGGEGGPAEAVPGDDPRQGGGQAVRYVGHRQGVEQGLDA